MLTETAIREILSKIQKKQIEDAPSQELLQLAEEGYIIIKNEPIKMRGAGWSNSIPQINQYKYYLTDKGDDYLK